MPNKKEETNFFGNRKEDRFVVRTSYDMIKYIIGIVTLIGFLVAFGNSQYFTRKEATEFKMDSQKLMGEYMVEQRLLKQDMGYVKDGVKRIEEKLK